MSKNKTSTKVLRDRHPITCNLSDAEYREVQAALTVMLRRTGLDLKPGTYAKHALLTYPKQRMAIDLIKNMIAEAGSLNIRSLDVEAVKTALSAVLA